MVKASVIIPTFQGCKTVNRLLTALNNQTFPSSEFEVIVSIDGSDDLTKKMVQQFSAPYELRYLWEPNSGRASACNRGISRANGDVVIILDDDMEPVPGFVEAHYVLHISNDNSVVMGAAPISIDNLSDNTARYIGNKFNSHLRKISQPGYSIKIRDFYSGNFSSPRDLLFKTGLYNETFKLYGNEDVELAHRFIKNQIFILFSNEACAIQHYEKKFLSLARDTISKGKTAVQLVNKYPETFTELKLIEYNCAGWKWRALRAFLISTSLFFKGTSDIIALVIDGMTRLRPSRTDYFYELSLDYLFWLGVWTAIKADKNYKLESQIKSYTIA